MLQSFTRSRQIKIIKAVNIIKNNPKDKEKRKKAIEEALKEGGFKQRFRSKADQAAKEEAIKNSIDSIAFNYPLFNSKILSESRQTIIINALENNPKNRHKAIDEAIQEGIFSTYFSAKNAQLEKIKEIKNYIRQYFIIHSSVGKGTFVGIPNNVQNIILSNLSPKELVCLNETSNYFYGFSQNNLFWKIFLRPEILNNVTFYQNKPGQARELYKFQPHRLGKYITKNYLESNKINEPSVQKYIFKGIITFQEAINLEGYKVYNLNEPMLQNYIDKGSITFQEAINLRGNNIRNLNEPGVQKFIDKGSITFQEAVNLRGNNIRNLNEPGVQKFIDKGSITFQEAINLRGNNIRNLNEPGVQKFIDKGSITFQEAVNLRGNNIRNLNEPGVQKFIDKGSITFQEAINLRGNNIRNLNEPGVQKFIDNGMMTIQEALKMPVHMKTVLNNHDVQKYIDNRLTNIPYIMATNIGYVPDLIDNLNRI